MGETADETKRELTDLRAGMEAKVMSKGRPVNVALPRVETEPFDRPKRGARNCRCFREIAASGRASHQGLAALHGQGCPA